MLFHPWDSRLHALALLQPLRFCGRMCYSLYLVHWPICKSVSHVFFAFGIHDPMTTLIVTIPVAIGVSIFAAWSFHRLIEQRFINARRVPFRLAAPASLGLP